MTNVVVEHGSHRLDLPGLSEIAAIMHKAASETGPPELQIHYGSETFGQPQLWLMCLFGSDSINTEWCVRFVFPKAKTSKYLASEKPDDNQFVARTLCGCEELIRRECVLDETTAIEAVDWFLEHGTASPAMIWLDSNQCFANV